MASSTVRMQPVAILQYRARFINDPMVRELHSRFDSLLNEVLELEKQHGYLRNLLPDGAWASQRKPLSYGGCLRDGRDAGNWTYAVVMRSLMNAGLTDYGQCNDVLLGDVIEAMLHLGFNVYRDPGPFLSYAKLLNEVCLVLLRIEDWARRFGYWETSRQFAFLLL